MSADIALNYLFCLCVFLCVLCVYLRYLTKELICHCSIFHKVIQDGIIAISLKKILLCFLFYYTVDLSLSV